MKRSTPLTRNIGAKVKYYRKLRGLSQKQLAAVIRPHPTYVEAVTEAVEDLEGMAIHMAKKRRI